MIISIFTTSLAYFVQAGNNAIIILMAKQIMLMSEKLENMTVHREFSITLVI